MRYLLGIFATIGLIVLILVLLLRGGGSGSPAPKALNLIDYAKNDSAAHFVLDGPIVANQNYNEVKIDVDANEVTFSLVSGYQGQVVKQQTYPNNVNSYSNFLLALQHQGFTEGNNDPKMKDERGYCPLGQRRIYSLTNGSDQLMRYWSTGCNAKTFRGNVDNVYMLFRAQVPDYGKLTSGANLNLF
ncbi:MAG: hypothetical protein ACREGB_05525 [Candidatus Saccharimonadales bacterium]